MPRGAADCPTVASAVAMFSPIFMMDIIFLGKPVWKVISFGKTDSGNDVVALDQRSAGLCEQGTARRAAEGACQL